MLRHTSEQDSRNSLRAIRKRPPTSYDYTYELFAADHEALREYLGLEGILVMGHSQGGMHAMQYALHYPEGCAGLILLDTLPAFDDHYREDQQGNQVVLQRMWGLLFLGLFSALIIMALPHGFALQIVTYRNVLVAV